MLNGANTAWLLVSSALALLMTPGLALFYGGLNRSKSVLNMMMMSFSSMAVVTVVWIAYGFSVAFGDDLNGLWGNPTQYQGTRTFIADSDIWGTVGVPLYVFMAFQMMFAIITVALISGALADRIRFAGWLVFAGGWVTILYFPVAHMVWGGGFIGSTIGALDLAGGWPCTSTPALPRRPWWRGAGSGGRRSRSSHTTCRWSRSGPGCCGWAGSASTPARG